MAWNWYPPVAEDTAKLPPRLHGHADMDVITLLYQRTGNLSHHVVHSISRACTPLLLHMRTLMGTVHFAHVDLMLGKAHQLDLHTQLHEPADQLN